jgi:hypothetical protein
MKNEVKSGIRTLALDSRLEKIREEIRKGDFGKSTATEGGTGLKKLARAGSTSADGSRTQLSFGFTSDTFFEVRVAIPTRIENIGEG